MKHTILDKNGEEIKVNLTPMKAIRHKCMNCSGFSYREVKLCPIKHCPLFPYRFGKRPAKMSNQ